MSGGQVGQNNEIKASKWNQQSEHWYNNKTRNSYR